jgi:WD40 repeat protein
LVSGSADSTVRVWDLNRCQNIQTQKEHNGDVYCARFDGQFKVVSGGADKFIRVWDTRTKEKAKQFSNDSIIFDCSLVENLIFTASGDNGIRIFDTRTGGLVRIIRAGNEANHSIFIKENVLAAGGLDKIARVNIFSA